jgi:hypothetical protein
MIDVNTMTISELFGEMMACRGVTSNSTTLEVIQALVDTTRQASETVADIAADVLYDFLDGAYREYTEVLTENEGEYISNRTGEVVSVTMIP